MALPEIIWRGQPDKIYLTFDDGPDPDTTPRLLSLLAKYNIRACFFIIGKKAERHPGIVQEIAKAGHQISNHSFSHHRMVCRSRDFLTSELKRTNSLIADITGRSSRLFRPPHGHFGPGILKLLLLEGQKTVLWSRSTQDYKVKTTPITVKQKLMKTGPGDIVLMHDGHRNGTHMVAGLADFLAESDKPNSRFGLLE